MGSSFSNNNTPITLNSQGKSYKIPVSTNVPIELTPGSPVLRKTPTKEEITSNNSSYIQHQIDLLKHKVEKNTVMNMEFQRSIEKTLTKAKLNDRDEVEILHQRIVILEKENECLKNEVRNQNKIIQTLLTDERKERWITVNKRSLEVENKVYEHLTLVPVNLKNRFQNLEQPSITEQHNDATPQN